MVNEHLLAILNDKIAFFNKIWDPWIKYLSDASSDVYNTVSLDRIEYTSFFALLFLTISLSLVFLIKIFKARQPCVVMQCNLGVNFSPAP